SEDSTFTYTTISSPYKGLSGDVSPGVDGPPVMPEDPYAYVVAVFQSLPPPDYVPGPEEPEQAPPLPIYIPYIPEPVYPEYIPPEDDDEDDDDEEEEHPASADSIPPPPVLHVTARISFRPQVTELATVQEQDTQDIYGVIEDTQGRQTEIFQRVEALVDNS
nr:hypothetical protein [Tanacetum cinerariifolium]